MSTLPLTTNPNSGLQTPFLTCFELLLKVKALTLRPPDHLLSTP